jgi:hypothetical protein
LTSFLFKGIIQQLWGLIKGIQYPMSLYLQEISLPGVTSAVIKVLRTISDFDVFSGDVITEYFFTFS